MKIDKKIGELILLAEDLGLEKKSTREARRKFHKQEFELFCEK